MDISQKIISRLKLRQLKLVVAMDDMKTLRAASEQIGMSQPAATQSLRELEDALSCQLFKRTNRGVETTRYGRVLVRHARAIISHLRHAGDELNDLESGAGGRVIVGTLLASSAFVLPQAILRMREKRPNVIIKVIEGTNDILMPRLLQGDIDLVVGRLSEQRYRQGTEQTFLYNEDVVIFTSPNNPLASRAVLSLEELANEDWILPPIETTLRSQLEKLFFNANLQPPHCAIESTSWLTNRFLWRNSNLIGIAPAHTVREMLDRGELAALNIQRNARLGPVGISTRIGAELSSAANCFIDELKVTCEDFR